MPSPKQPPTPKPSTTTEKAPTQYQTGESNQSDSEEEENQYFFFVPHSTNIDPSHKDPFYSQKVHHVDSNEEMPTESPNEIPENIITTEKQRNQFRIQHRSYREILHKNEFEING